MKPSLKFKLPPTSIKDFSSDIYNTKRTNESSSQIKGALELPNIYKRENVVEDSEKLYYGGGI